jgi:hypothetical protein
MSVRVRISLVRIGLVVMSVRVRISLVRIGLVVMSVRVRISRVRIGRVVIPIKDTMRAMKTRESHEGHGFPKKSFLRI